MHYFTCPAIAAGLLVTIGLGLIVRLPERPGPLAVIPPMGFLTAGMILGAWVAVRL